ncbi:uberolysin/carnocyclin family circular bacteriocin [Bacillus sp. WLY-B-L8]|uniref:uberolysin/carnocyclin family circular bacteriocin n=1 Tax=Bacillus multifaciens TaxID=3068506 RepID=UPI0027424C6D|nr:uberolysin/carnocyclin family circular bacteriocin [Bacillus sp. WLY-B-L8]MDP7981440.1 uberolysin/carnocyclin family circular bacteriocin [Bacillus sp. WLY-B-L8]
MEKQKKIKNYAATLTFGSAGLLMLSSAPHIAGTLGVSTGTANQVVTLIDQYQTATAIVSIVGAITGVGGITAGIVSTVLFLLKKKGKAKAAAW